MSNDLASGTPQSPRVFISYSHDSEAHRDLLLRLANRLRADGVHAVIDQYVSGTPEEGWPRWMLNQLDWATFVIIICTPTYYSRFRGHEISGRGKGADWEGSIITNEIYHSFSRTAKFVPVLMTADAELYIPEPLLGHTRYVLDNEQGYTKLHKFLTGQSGAIPHPLGRTREHTTSSDSGDAGRKRGKSPLAPGLSVHVRVREFKTLIAERTRNFTGREFVLHTIDDFLEDRSFPSGYIVLTGAGWARTHQRTSC